MAHDPRRGRRSRVISLKPQATRTPSPSLREEAQSAARWRGIGARQPGERIPRLGSAVCDLRSGVCGLGSAVWGLRSGVCGLGLRSGVCGLGSAVCDLRSGVCGLGSAVWGLRSGVWVWGLGSGVCGLGSAVWGLGSAVWGLGSAVCDLRSVICGLAKPPLAALRFFDRSTGGIVFGGADHALHLTPDPIRIRYRIPPEVSGRGVVAGLEGDGVDLTEVES